VEDPAIDLAVVCAVLSSNKEEPVGQDVCLAAEVGLSGEIRAVSRVEQRILEAEKLGFTKIILSKFSKVPKTNYKIEVCKVSRIEEVVQELFST
jgi:DNA repair protein RadA/Sms